MLQLNLFPGDDAKNTLVGHIAHGVGHAVDSVMQAIRPDTHDATQQGPNGHAVGGSTIRVQAASSTSTREDYSTAPNHVQQPCVMTVAGNELDINIDVLKQLPTVSELKMHIAESKQLAVELVYIESLELLWKNELLEDDYRICGLQKADITVVVQASESYRMNEQEGMFTGSVNSSGLAHGKGRLVHEDGRVFIGKFSAGELCTGVRYSRKCEAECTFDKAVSCGNVVDESIASKYPYTHRLR